MALSATGYWTQYFERLSVGANGTIEGEAWMEEMSHLNQALGRKILALPFPAILSLLDVLMWAVFPHDTLVPCLLWVQKQYGSSRPCTEASQTVI